ncbi:MAG: hypothetical protein NVS3B10_06170 [Polyangiales bacterium]
MHWTMRLRASPRLALVPFTLLAAAAVVSCSHKMNDEDCNALLGRGIGLAMYSGSAEVPVDVEALRKRARGAPKRAIVEFDQLCHGADENDAITCTRRANDSAQFVACGPLTKRAREAGEIVQQLIAKRHSADECAKYAEHGVKIGVGTADDAGHLVRDCDEAMEVGVYRCRLGAKDPAAWDACIDL